MSDRQNEGMDGRMGNDSSVTGMRPGEGLPADRIY